MDNQCEQGEKYMRNSNNFWSFIGGLLLGGVAGTIGMMLYVPQSGANTRLQIQQKGIELRNLATDAVEDVVLQTRHETQRINTKIQHQVEKLQQRSQEVLDEQKQHLTAVVDNGNNPGHTAIR